MPTIDQLGPATSVSDTDEFIVSQAGKTRKITRAQIVSGVQAQIVVPGGSLLGNPGNSVGVPQSITVGQNLTFIGSTLAAVASPFVIPNLPTGNVPASGDLIPMSQAGTTVAVSYRELLSGLSGAMNMDLSQAWVTPSGAPGGQTLAQLTANLLPLSGGTISGTLTLSAAPTSSGHATNKAYVDQRTAAYLALNGGSLTGTLSLSSAPLRPLDAATKAYTDAVASTTLPLAGGSLAGTLFLANDPITALQAATKQYADLKVSRAGDTMAGSLILAGAPVSALQAATKNYVDVSVSSALPLRGGTLLGALYLASDPVLNGQAATKQYADSKLSRAGDTLSGPLILAADPSQALQAATKNYVDGQVSHLVSQAGASMAGPLLLASDPSTALQASTKQYTDLRVSRAGDSLTGALYLASDPVGPSQAATKSYVDTRFAAAVSTSGASFAGSVTLASNPSAPLQAATKQYVDNQIATALPNAGGTLTGSLVLAGPPTVALQAATKSYVDANPNAQGVINISLPPFNAKLDGVTDDTVAFKGAYQAAAAGATIYVPHGTTVVQQPGTWGISLTKRVKWVVDGTVLADGTPLASSIPAGGGPSGFVLPGFVVGNTSGSFTTSQGASQSTDFALNLSSYIVNHSGGNTGNVITNTRADTIIYSSPANYVWGGLDRVVWAGTQAPSASTVTQHVGRYIQTLRQSTTIGPNGSYLPQPQLWGACIEYRDLTGKASSTANSSLTVEMDWFGNGADDANSRTIQSLVVGQHDTSGAAVEVGNIIGVWLSGGSKGSAKSVFFVALPFSNAVLDTTSAQQINDAPVIKLAAGQAIAFEATATNKLLYDTGTGTLRWKQGSQSYPVGKGISVGWANVCNGSTTLTGNLAGNIVFLIGSGNYTVTLPPANSVAAGTGFTFSVTGTGPVNIVPYGTDRIDAGPITLRPHDRYHIVSDGSSYWYEVFWTNAVSPRFSAAVVLPSYAVANLPTGMMAGAKAFVSNGRKPGEGAGAGSGVEVFFDGQNWISSCNGSMVTA